MGDPDQPHSYSYTPDVAAALITLGTHPAATGSVWHLPVAETRTTRQIIDRSTSWPGTGPELRRRTHHPALFGLIKPAMREYLHTLYQFTDRWVVDDSKFRTAFGHPPRRWTMRSPPPSVVPGRRQVRAADRQAR